MSWSATSPQCTITFKPASRRKLSISMRWRISSASRTRYLEATVDGNTIKSNGTVGTTSSISNHFDNDNGRYHKQCRESSVRRQRSWWEQVSSQEAAGKQGGVIRRAAAVERAGNTGGRHPCMVRWRSSRWSTGTSSNSCGRWFSSGSGFGQERVHATPDCIRRTCYTTDQAATNGLCSIAACTTCGASAWFVFASQVTLPFSWYSLVKSC